MSKVDETVLTPQLRIFVMGERDSTKILVTGLHGDQDFEPTDNCYFRTADSQRWEVNRVIKEQAMNLGLGHQILNTDKYIGTTGWTIYGARHANSVRAIAQHLANCYGIAIQN